MRRIIRLNRTRADFHRRSFLNRAISGSTANDATADTEFAPALTPYSTTTVETDVVLLDAERQVIAAAVRAIAEERA